MSSDVSRETDMIIDVSPETPIANETLNESQRWDELRSKRFQRPRHTRIFSVSNQKGGVGKTTTTVNLASALASVGMNVLVIDADPQGNASTALGVPHSVDTSSVYDVLVNDEPLSNVVKPSNDVQNLRCAPSTVDLSGAEIELVNKKNREYVLKNAIQGYIEQRKKEGLPRLDYIFIDCPPSLGLLTLNSLAAATEVLIPVQSEYYALEGLTQLISSIQQIQQQINPELDVSTMLMTMYDGRTRLAIQVANEVETHFPEQLLNARIPRSVRISEAPSFSKTVITHAPDSLGALAYIEAAQELSDFSRVKKRRTKIT